MRELRVQYAEGKDTFKHYRGQHQPQSAEIVLDLPTGLLTAGYNPEIGPAISGVRHWGHLHAWDIPHLNTGALTRVLNHIREDAQTALNGYEQVRRGGNTLGVLDESAKSALSRIRDYLLNLEVGESDRLVVWDATDFYANVPSAIAAEMFGITVDTTDDELLSITNLSAISGDTETVDVLTGELAYLQYLRHVLMGD
jgi:hypothetical protein